MTSENWAEGRIALITGASSGFGAALARRVVKGGGRVIAIGRRADRLAALTEELGERLLPRAIDIRDEAAIRATVAELPEDFAAIDILFNNAGLALGMGRAPDTGMADWKAMIDTNVTGLVTVTDAVLPGMVARNRGDIVNVSSVAARYPYPGANVYGATKAFVSQFSINLRADLLGKNIRVTAIEPGMCETEFSVVRFNGDQQAADAVYADMKPLSADDIALTVETLLRLPPHININVLELMPVQQAFSPFAVDRGGA